MKTIGLLGGMSWESTVSYYRAINSGIKDQLGGFHSSKLALYSVDFAEIETLQSQGDWQQAGVILAQAAQAVEAAGADFFLIGTNTMHKVAAQAEAAVSIPLLHIADATAAQLKADGVERVGLLGTRFTMEQDFYKGRLTDKHGIRVLVPDENAQDVVHRVIYEELCQGKISDSSRKAYVKIIEDLSAGGAQAVILGCTEIALLVSQSDTAIPLYDTTAIHATAAVKLALA
ncbi:aspartate/glutamate racemase family protein [Amphritea sp.]|uniref:aspartate/glutamate racemase family protein n=1 Tax=Amphritea sp. TaxID=1872502 RepID=UPI0025C40A57|nr:aspartate/glutamate racemase family protein [Amphritea sp.]